jgi:MFS transporter, YQGE family, putative transporter
MYLLFGVQLIFSIVFSFANLFLNVFLWDSGQSFWDIGIYNVFSALSIFAAFLLGSLLIRWVGSRLIFVISALFACFLFLDLFYTGVVTRSSIPWLGALYGGFIGFFYCGFNLHLLVWARKDNRSFLIGLEYVITSATQLIVPFVSGFLIVQVGYGVAFFILLILIFIQFLLSCFVPGLRMSKEDSSQTSSRALYNKEMMQMGASCAAFGFFNAFVQMAFGLFLFFFVEDEFHLGSWNLLFGVLTVLAYWTVGKRLNSSNQVLFLNFGMMGSTMVTLVLLMSEPKWFILFNLAVSITLPMIWLPLKSYHYQLIRHSSKMNGREDVGSAMNGLVFRELSLTFGRVCFFLLMLAGFELGGYAYFVMIGLAVLMPIGMRVFRA